jgi:hypothetical protein
MGWWESLYKVFFVVYIFFILGERVVGFEGCFLCDMKTCSLVCRHVLTFWKSLEPPCSGLFTFRVDSASFPRTLNNDHLCGLLCSLCFPQNLGHEVYIRRLYLSHLFRASHYYLISLPSRVSICTSLVQFWWPCCCTRQRLARFGCHRVCVLRWPNYRVIVVCRRREDVVCDLLCRYLVKEGSLHSVCSREQNVVPVIRRHQLSGRTGQHSTLRRWINQILSQPKYRLSSLRFCCWIRFRSFTVSAHHRRWTGRSKKEILNAWHVMSYFELRENLYIQWLESLNDGEDTHSLVDIRTRTYNIFMMQTFYSTRENRIEKIKTQQHSYILRHMQRYESVTNVILCRKFKHK